MAAFYDARGNTYFVASPEEIGGFADLPRTAPEAARKRERWARRAIERICGRPNVSEGIETGGAKRYRSDGLLVGPFPDEHAFALLIVNTDGTLAERSGNGLTIFSQCLIDTGRASNDASLTTSSSPYQRRNSLSASLRPFLFIAFRVSSASALP